MTEWREELLDAWVSKITEKSFRLIPGLSKDEVERLRHAARPGAEADLYDFLIPRISTGLKHEIRARFVEQFTDDERLSPFAKLGLIEAIDKALDG